VTFIEDLFAKGGPVMWPLLLCSLMSLTIIIERLIFWWRVERRRNDSLMERIFSFTERGDYEAAIAAGNDSLDISARVLHSGLINRSHGLTEAMQIETGNEVARMKQGLIILDTIITVAPLLGILGTVLGIIDSFNLLGTSGVEDPKAATGGIAEALITTAAGLSIAIPTLIPFNYFVARVQREALRLEQFVTYLEVAYKRSLENQKFKSSKV